MVSQSPGMCSHQQVLWPCVIQLVTSLKSPPEFTHGNKGTGEEHRAGKTLQWKSNFTGLRPWHIHKLHRPLTLGIYTIPLCPDMVIAIRPLKKTQTKNPPKQNHTKKNSPLRSIAFHFLKKAMNNYEYFCRIGSSVAIFFFNSSIIFALSPRRRAFDFSAVPFQICYRLWSCLCS